jgi:hypothetical protein
MSDAECKESPTRSRGSVDAKIGLQSVRVLVYVMLAVLPTAAQTTNTKATAKKSTVAESAEHAFARTNLEKNEQRLASIDKVSACLKLVNQRKSSGRDPSTEELQTCSYDLNGTAFDDSVRTFCVSFEGVSHCDTYHLALDLSKARLALLEKNILAKAVLDTVDTCVRAYRTTIDKKMSDLTTRQTQQIEQCKQDDLYPPPKK